MDLSEHRPDEEQTNINKLADIFFEPNEQDILSQALKKEYTNILYTQKEANQLASKFPMDLLMGVGENAKGSAGYPFLQFYDFVFTIDRILAQIRLLTQHTMNMDSMISAKNKTLLRKNILNDKFVDWPILDRLTADDLIFPSLKTGNFSIGSPSISDMNIEPNVSYILRSDKKENLNTIGPQQHALRKKTNYEKSCDEAKMLDYHTVNDIIAVGQGLFRLHKCKARMFDKDGKESDEMIPKFAFINAHHGKAGESTFAAKITDLKYYPQNWMGRFMKMVGDKKQAEEHYFIGHSETNPQYTGQGGAIGLVQYEYDYKEADYNSAPPEDVHIKNAAQTTLDEIHNAMSSKKTHPIKSVARLSRAYKRAYISTDVHQKYRNLTKIFTSKQSQTTLDANWGEALEMYNNRNKGQQFNNIRCPSGTVPIFIGHDGKELSIGEAIIMSNGKEVLSPLVDQSRSYCKKVPNTKSAAERFRTMNYDPASGFFGANNGSKTKRSRKGNKRYKKEQVVGTDGVMRAVFKLRKK